VLAYLTIGRPAYRDIAEPVNEGIHGREFDSRIGRENALGGFERHTTDVRAAVPPDRLLVYGVSRCWEPLCAFLGAPVPDEPFLRVNSTRSSSAGGHALSPAWHYHACWSRPPPSPPWRSRGGDCGASKKSW
jgi:hypothetical protein